MYECLDLFSEPTKVWFKHAFSKPTAAQSRAWPHIVAGENVLVVAPTGSGKTLAAFLAAIDGLIRSKTGDASTSQDVRTGSACGGVPDAVHRAGTVTAGSARRRGVKVLYISPLKALGVDVENNLGVPLTGISAECERQGIDPPDIEIAVRTGDTTAKQRRQIAVHPPDILITTPESLYLLLTSKARDILRDVETVIVDEVHALASTKRGAHLALSLERLELLVNGDGAKGVAGRPGRVLQRIGLSATVNPAEEAARFLGGDKPVTIVDVATAPALDVRIVGPCAGLGSPSDIGMNGTSDGLAKTPMGSDINERSVWPAVERSILDEVLRHRTTLVFVNSRGLAERLTARLNDLYAQTVLGDPAPDDYGTGAHYDSVAGSSTTMVGSHPQSQTIAMAHHGSVSKERRKIIETDLKQGRLKCVVATSSLELGIDMGTVDLVIQIAPPLSVSSALQRVGRANHQVGGVSHALFYPITGMDLIGQAVTVEDMARGDLETLSVLHNPLDILAQQTVAAAAMDDLNAGRWYESVRRTAPYSTLSRPMFDSVIGMMTGAYNSEDFSAFRPPLQFNEHEGIISARPGAQRLAVTSGGTIPDRGAYAVVLPEPQAGNGRRKVGELDEEMVYESRVGDVITLGTSTWQIDEITQDRVVVTPAPGRTARLPFWHGEGPGRPADYGKSLGAFTRQLSDGLVDAASDGDASTVRSGRNVLDESTDELEDRRISDRFGDDNPSSTWGPCFDEACANRLKQDGMDANGQTNLASLLAKQRAATGVVPDDRTLVVERSRDEEGDWRIILHSPYGRRVHEPWALAVTNRLKRKYGYDGQVYAADDGMVVRLPEQDGRMSAADLFLFDADDLQRDVEQEIGDSVLFATRFRQCAARSLFMPRMSPGKRVPLWQQRLRASELLAAAKTQRNFPLLLETARECLQDVYDMPALHKLMEALNTKRVVVRDVETDTPSLMAQNLLFGFVGSVMYEYDSPQAERRASVLSMDPDVLEDLLGQGKIADVLDPEVTAEVEHELADREFWNELADDDMMGRLLRFSKTHGPFTAEDAVQQLGLDVTSVVHGLDELNAQGKIDTGVFVSGGPQTQYINRDVFRRIRSRSLVKARKAVKPVGSSVYQSWLFDHAGIGDRSRLSGVDGVLRVIEQLEGLPLPANLWESAVFPARVGDFRPTMLDELLADGEVYWVGSKDGMSCDDEPSAKMMSPGKVSWYLAGSMLPALADDRWTVSGTGVNQAGVGVVAPDGAGVIDAPVGNRGMNRASNADGRPVQADGTQRERSGDAVMDMRDCIMGMLRAGGSYRAERLADCCRSRARGTSEGIEELVDPFTGELIDPELSDSRFEYVLWSLVWEGKVTNSSFAAVRALCAPQGARGSVKRGGSRRMAGRARVRPTTRTPQALTGLWSAVHRDQIGSQTIEQRAVAVTEAILDRYGVVSPEVVDADGIAGGFKGIYPVLKRMEETGSVVRGRFIDGFSALQFATRQTVDELRQWHADRSTLAVVVDAADPMSLTGAAIAWPPVDHAQTSGWPRSSGTFDQVDEGRESGAPSVVGLPDPMEASKESNPQRASNLIKAANTVCVPEVTGRSPDHKVWSQPKRVVGAVVVYLEGVPILYAAPAGHHLIRFASTDYEMRRALSALADTIRRWYDRGLSKRTKGGIWFRDINGEPIVSESDLSRLMRAAGFAPTPQGAKLYL